MTLFPLRPEGADGGRNPDSRSRCRVEGEHASTRRPGSTAPATDPPGPPFFTQHGRQLLLLDEVMAGWVMAEFWFDPDRCRYVEIRRARYDWPREAAGALLSRTITAGDDVLARTATELHDWIDQRATDDVLNGSSTIQ